MAPRTRSCAVLACALVGLATGMARWREQWLRPAAKLDDFSIQVEPAYNEMLAIGTLMSGDERIRADLQTPESREQLSQRLHLLRARGATNLIRLTRVSTPDPELQAIRQVLVMAQPSQLSASIPHSRTSIHRRLSLQCYRATEPNYDTTSTSCASAGRIQERA